MALIDLHLHFPEFEITEVLESDAEFEICAVSTQSEARCPDCGNISSTVHSYYQRAPADLAILGKDLRLRLKVKRFRCRNGACSKATFVEQIPGLIRKYAQRTTRLQAVLEVVAFALGGQAGSRLAARLKMPASRNTLLRILRNSPRTIMDEPEVIGVDDWALRRGQVYGTILVDLERRRGIDLLPDRTAETLAAWLQLHPKIKTVARDRSSEYARGITNGAPQAEQVADRFHLLVNLRETLERLIDRLRPNLMENLPAKDLMNDANAPVIRHRHRSWEYETGKEGHRMRFRAVFDEVHRRHKDGQSSRAISKDMKMSRTTIRRYLALPGSPQNVERKRRPSILDPFKDYLEVRWAAGCRNASALWREIREQGYPGALHQVAQWVYERRTEIHSSTPKRYLAPNSPLEVHLSSNKAPAKSPTLPVARRLVWLFLKSSSRLSSDERALRDILLTNPVLTQACGLAQDFIVMVSKRKPQDFDRWLLSCETSEIPELMNFAAGIRRDRSAVLSALSSTWSNGQTEGHVNRLKLLKRQMFGRANFDLLRLRYLQPP